MRILLLAATVFLLAACSPADDTAGRGSTPAPGRTSFSGGRTSPSAGRAPTVNAAASPRRPPTAPEPTAAPTAAPPARTAGAHTVTVALSGSARRVSVTYTTPDGQIRHSVVSPPWTRTFTVTRPRARLDVTAHTDTGGSLNCSLKVDGELLKSAMTSGDSMTVDCGDSLTF